MRLIFTENGYLNLAFLKLAKPKPNGRLELIGHDDQILDADCPRGILNTVTSLVQPIEAWEVLMLHGGDDQVAWQGHPIVAWGMTMAGQVVPIAANGLGDVDPGDGQPQAIRKIGDPNVYCGDVMYPDADTWFADARSRQAGD